MHFVFSLSLDVCPAWHAAAKSMPSIGKATQMERHFPIQVQVSSPEIDNFQHSALRFPSWKLFPSQGIRPASQSELLPASFLDFSRESAKTFAPTTLFKRNRIRSASQSDLLPASLLDFNRESLMPFAPATLLILCRNACSSCY